MFCLRVLPGPGRRFPVMSSLSLIDHFKRTIELSQEEEEELQKLKSKTASI